LPQVGWANREAVFNGTKFLFGVTGSGDGTQLKSIKVSFALCIFYHNNNNFKRTWETD
jgi:hypothetical protein